MNKISVCILLCALALYGCERFQQKWESRGRRLDYLKQTIDSARKQHDRVYTDSLAKITIDSASKAKK
jgi:hypothetical protein